MPAQRSTRVVTQCPWLWQGPPTGEVNLLLGAEAHHDHFIHVLCVFLENHLQRGCAGLHHLRLVAHIREFKLCSRSYPKREVAVDVGDCTVFGITFYLDSGTDNGFTLVVHDLPFDGAALFYYLSNPSGQCLLWRQGYARGQSSQCENPLGGCEMIDFFHIGFK